MWCTQIHHIYERIPRPESCFFLTLEITDYSTKAYFSGSRWKTLDSEEFPRAYKVKPQESQRKVEPLLQQNRWKISVKIMVIIIEKWDSQITNISLHLLFSKSRWYMLSSDPRTTVNKFALLHTAFQWYSQNITQKVRGRFAKVWISKMPTRIIEDNPWLSVIVNTWTLVYWQFKKNYKIYLYPLHLPLN